MKPTISSPFAKDVAAATLALAICGLAPLAAQTSITITPGTRHQTMVGFGGAISWYNTWIYGGNNQKDAELNQLMFEDTGLDILRLKNWYYPADSSASGPAAAAEQAFTAAKAANPDIQVLLSSWSPPASLKSNGIRTDGGTLAKDGNDDFRYDDLAAYWVDLLDNMGWSPDYISFQNEPGWSADWESCIFEGAEGANASYSIASDAIWNAIEARPDAPKMIGSEAANMGAFFVQNDQLAAKAYLEANAYHIYDINDASKIDHANTLTKYHQIRDDYTARPNWMTEYSNLGMDWIAAARVVHNTVVEANAAAYIYWKLAWGGNDVADSMVRLTNTNGSYTVGPHFYTIKHYAKHVDQGHERIEIGGSTTDVKVSGYLAPDLLSITLVAINNADSSDTIQLTHDQLPISGIAGYQSVDGNFYQTMSGLDAANALILPAKSMTTLVLTLSETFNARPVAEDASLSTREDTDLPLILQASDAEDETLSYTVLSGPSHGILSGSGANHTYSPSEDYTGPDSITFKVNDGNHDSNTATITISVDPPNLAPSVNAGEDKVVVLTAGSVSNPVAGGYFEWDAANDGIGDNEWNSETTNTYTWIFDSAQSPASVTDARFNEIDTAYEFPAAIATAASFTGLGDTESATFELVLDTDTDNGVIFESGGSGTGLQFDIHDGKLRFIVRPDTTATVLSAPLSATDRARMIHVIGVIDLASDALLLYLDGNLVDSDLNFTGGDWSGGNGSGLGKMNSSTASENSSSGTELNNFTGKIALVRYYKNQVFGPANVTSNFNALSSGPSASVTLSGSSSDSDGPSTLTTTWSVVNGSGVSFGDANALSTTARFTAAGTYTLRLTADDGLDHNTDDVVITVLAGTPYDNWGGGVDFDADHNGDGIASGMAWIFGADDPNADATSLQPGFDNTSDIDYFIVSYRRSDAAHADTNTGIALQYSSTLSNWTDAVDDGNNVIITTSNDFHGTGVDKVEVKLKRTLAVGGNLFFRIRAQNTR